MPSRNRVALLIPHYNNPTGLNRTLASVGPDEPCDVVVVDDGSIRMPLEEAAARESLRANGDLKIIRLAHNQGIEGALNTGLQWIRERGYEFVARLDCGDRNTPHRIARQVEFMDENPDVVLVGTRASYVDLAGVERFVLPLPADHDEILRYLRTNSAFMHPSVMFRTSVLDRTGMYPTDAPRAEDYALFWEMAKVGRVANIPEPLIEYELDPDSLSLGGRREQLKSRLAIQRRNSDGSFAAWKGIVRTLGLLAMPYGAVLRLKSVRNRAITAKERPNR